MKIGENIYRLRKSKGISQEDLANELNVSRQSVSLWETNQTLPSIDNLLAMSTLFEVTVDELCKGEGAHELLIGGEKEKNFLSDGTRTPLAHSVTLYNEDIYKLSLKIVLQKHFIVLWLCIVFSLFVLTGSILGGVYDYIVFPIIALIIFAVRLIQMRVYSKKQLNTLLSTEKNRKAQYRFYNDYFDLSGTTDNSEGHYSKRYDEISSVIEKDRYIFIYFDERYSVIDKADLGSGLETVLNLFRNNSKKFKSAAEKIDNTPVTAKNVKLLKTVSLAFFILSFFSLFIALALVALASAENLTDADPSAAMENMWLFFVVLPIPLSSLAIGLYCGKKGIKAKRNIIIGVIFSLLLCIYGSFFFVFGGMYTHDYSYVGKISNEIEIPLPHNGEITTQNWENRSYSGEERIFLLYSSTVKFTEESEIALFETQIAQSARWTNSVSNMESLIGPYFYFILKDYDFFLIYNSSLGQYCAPETQGLYNLVFLAYDAEKNILVIIEYQLFIT